MPTLSAGQVICSCLVAANLVTLILLSNSGVLGTEQVTLAREQNLVLARTLLTRNTSAALHYAQEAVQQTDDRSIRERALVLKELGRVELKANSPESALKNLTASKQFMEKWQASCLPKDSELVSDQIVEVNYLIGLANGKMRRFTAAISSLDEASKILLTRIAEENRQACRVRLIEIANLKAFIAQRGSQKKGSSDRLMDELSTLLYAPETASSSALRRALLSPPPAEVWNTVRTERQIVEAFKTAGVKVVENDIEILRQYPDSSGRAFPFEIALASLITCCVNAGNYSDASRLSLRLSEILATQDADSFARVDAFSKHIEYLLAAGGNAGAAQNFSRLMNMISSVKVQSPSQWDAVYDDLEHIAELVAANSASFSVDERLSFFAAFKKLLMVRQVSRPISPAVTSICLTDLTSLIERGDSPSKEHLSSFTPQEIENAACTAGLHCLRKGDIAHCTSALQLGIDQKKFAGVQPPGAELGAIVEEATIMMNHVNKVRNAETVLELVHQLKNSQDPFTAVRLSACKYILEGAKAGEARLADALALTNSEKEKSQARQYYLDVVQDHLARHDKTSLPTLIAPYQMSVEDMKNAWGENSLEYAAALLQQSSLHERLKEYQPALVCLKRCENITTTLHNALYGHLVREHQLNCLRNLAQQQSRSRR